MSDTTCANDENCEIIGLRTIDGVRYTVYFCEDTESYKEYAEDTDASPPGGNNN